MDGEWPMLGNKEEGVGLRETVTGETVANDSSVELWSCIHACSSVRTRQKPSKLVERREGWNAPRPGASPGATANRGTPLWRWTIDLFRCRHWDPSLMFSGYILGTFIGGSQIQWGKSRVQLSRCSWLGVEVEEEQGKEQETLHRKSTIGSLLVPYCPWLSFILETVLKTKTCVCRCLKEFHMPFRVAMSTGPSPSIFILIKPALAWCLSHPSADFLVQFHWGPLCSENNRVGNYSEKTAQPIPGDKVEQGRGKSPLRAVPLRKLDRRHP